MLLDWLTESRVALQGFLDIVAPGLQTHGPQLVVLTISIAAYSVFVYTFYRFIAKRDIFGWNELEYQAEQRDSFVKLMHIGNGIFRYGVFFPAVVFFWFACFSVLLFFMAKNLATAQLLMVSITFVTAIRITAYYTEDLSRELAKLIPFTFIAVAIVEPGFFSIPLVEARLAELPAFVPDIAAFFVFIVVVEWVLRVLLAIKHGLLGVGQPSEKR